MLRKLAILSLVLLSSSAMAKTLGAKAADAKVADQVPNCSADSDGRIDDAIMTSLHDLGLKKYLYSMTAMTPKDKVINKIELLSSEKISTSEQKRLMLRRAKKDHETYLVNSGLTAQYMNEPLYRQYYKITSSNGFRAIGEFYAAPGACAVDLESIYIISEQLVGSIPDFAN